MGKGNFYGASAIWENEKLTSAFANDGNINDGKVEHLEEVFPFVDEIVMRSWIEVDYTELN